MNDTQPPDPQTAHKFFSATCFNAAWDLIDSEERSEDDGMRMLDLAHSSLWHWSQRQDCTEKHLSTGYWQLSRVYALLRYPELARAYGNKALSLTEESDPFNGGFAHEAIARAEMVAGNREAMNDHLTKARSLLERVSQTDDAAWLKQNLDDIA